MKPLAIVLAVVFLGLGIAYATGHGPGAMGEKHAKHAVLFVGLAILSLVWLRFQAGSVSSRSV